ncbi:hypothetical protein EST38_g9532 [Candolleomyces aberdarensis]|uniref:F-box domain-containing protein n=1 Tax=Candolleomyces aberdarensis TaxID=2316362 RepID=A0A4Q2DCK6_9AGAR|nr:hypothetical protein EST38_g9532 [Candolleomyces aberdarensis]
MVKLPRYHVPSPALQLFQRRVKHEAFDEWVTSYLQDVDDTVTHPQPFPAGILQIIFTEVTHSGAEDVDLTDKILIRTTILSCARVCRLWRSAVPGNNLNALWVHVLDFQRMPISRLKYLLTFSAPHRFDLEHRDAPFCVHRKRDLRVLEMLQDHYLRVREWNVKYCMGYRVDYDPRWLFSGQPFESQLRTLRWTGPTPNIADGLGGRPIPVLMLNKLAIHDVNFLPCMYLQHSGIPSQLTELSIRRLPRTAGLDPLQLLDTLRRTPYLQSLTLHDAITHDVHLLHPLLILDRTVNLLMLRKVSAADGWSMDPFFYLFMSMNIPAACDFELILPRNHSPDNQIFSCEFFFRIRITGLLNLYRLHGLVEVPPLALNIDPQSDYPITLGTVHNAAAKFGITETSMNFEDISAFPTITIKLRRLAEEELHQAIVHAKPLLEKVTDFRITLNDASSILESAPSLPFSVIWPMLVGMRKVTTLTMDQPAIVLLVPLLDTFLPMVMGEVRISIIPHHNGNLLCSESLDMTVRRDRSYIPAVLPTLCVRILIDFLKGSCRRAHLVPDDSGDELPILPNLSRIVAVEGVDLVRGTPASIALLQYLQWRWTTGCPVDVLSSEL